MRSNTSNLPLAVMLVLIVILMTALNPRFLTVNNIVSMSYQLPIVAILSIGMMFTILTGGINLALIATSNFTGIVIALILKAIMGTHTAEASIWVSLIALVGGLLAACLVGALMGWLIAYLDIPAMLATLGMMILLQGVNLVLTKGYTISGFPPVILAMGNGTIGIVPIPFIMLIVVCLILYVVLTRTVFGRNLYATGTNPIAAQYSNINVRSVLMRTYILSALFSALAVFITMGQLNSVKANYTESYLLVAVLACFLGGIDPFGGTGKLSGMVLSTVILQLISTGVNLLRMDPFFIQAMWGLIIIVVLLVYYVDSRIRDWRTAHKRSTSS